MKRASAIGAFLVALLLLAGCGAGDDSTAADENLLPATMEDAVFLARSIVGTMSLAQRLQERADAVESALLSGATETACAGGGTVAYASTEGGYPVTVTLEDCGEGLSRMTGALLYEKEDRNLTVTLLADPCLPGRESVNREKQQLSSGPDPGFFHGDGAGRREGPERYPDVVQQRRRPPSVFLLRRGFPGK